MIKIIPKCPKCKGNMSQPLVSDRTDDNFTQFYITYCPNCIELDDEVKAKVWCKTIKSKTKI